jgi:hypothetical protein
MRLRNYTGYDTRDLERFFRKGLKALGARLDKTVIVVSSPTRSRGCAMVGTEDKEGTAIVIAVAPPSRFTLRRLARLWEHEVLHTLGFEHEMMTEEEMYSLGELPSWARGERIRYWGRAPAQIP